MPQAKKVEKNNGSAVGEDFGISIENSTSPQPPVVGTSKAPDASPGGQEKTYIIGWRLHLTTIALWVTLFVVQMESSIVSTSVVTITNDLRGFDRSGWIFNSYLLAYSGLMIIWAKLSDIFGRKPLLLLALLIFIVFSGACGASQTLLQLIIFRCIQGMGASGVFSLVVIVFFELLPPKKWPTYTAVNTLVISTSLTLSPIFGGLINIGTSWRWVFLLNVPIGTAAMIMLILLLPRDSSNTATGTKQTFTFRNFQKVDFLGATFLLGTSTFLVTPLEQAASGVSFQRSLVLSMLVLSAFMFLCFLLCEWFITNKRTLPEPVFPWRFLVNRVCLGMIVNSYLAGTLFLVCVVQLPQRFEMVNDTSPFVAGTRLIAFVLFVPTSSAFAAVLLGKSKIPPNFILLAGAVLEIIGTVGLSVTSTTKAINASQYAFQIIMGVGVGFFNGVLILLIPYVVEKRDLGTGSAAISQFRVLGGTIGLAIVTTVMNSSLRSDLSRLLTPDQINLVLEVTESISSLPENLQTIVRSSFGRGYNLQMKIMIGFAVAQVPATVLMWTKEPIRISK